MLQVAILGASGYVGGELMRLIAAHPAMAVGVAYGASSAGEKIAVVHHGFDHLEHRIGFALIWVNNFQ